MALVATTQGPRRWDAAAARLAVAAALLSAGAGAIHAVAAASHFAVWAPFGILFVATAVLQTAWAAGVLVSPSPLVVGAGAAVNAGVAAAWALSRTAGLPVGPHAWTPEPVTLLDAAATAFELGIVAACAVLLLSRASDFDPLRATRFTAVAAVAAAALTAVPIALAGSGHDHGHAHDHASHTGHGGVHAGAPQVQAVARGRAQRAPAAERRARATRTRDRAPARHAHDHASHDHAHP